MTPVALLDIEGTIADIQFVKQVLFPYAKRALPDFVEAHADDVKVAAQLDAAAELAGIPGGDRKAVVGALIDWIDADRKATPLKALQGMIWRAGYENGDFTAHLYPDAHAWLMRARAAGIRLNVYSSGSVGAQKLYFTYSDFGNVVEWFDRFFDTTTGPKQNVDSYREIVAAIGCRAGEITFFSDVEAELDAAAQAGLETIQIVRPGTLASQHHRRYADFAQMPPRNP